MISTRQNTDINIKRLAAQRSIYFSVEKIDLTRIVIILSSMVLLVIIKFCVSSSIFGKDFKFYQHLTLAMVIIAFTVFISEIIFESEKQKCSTLAASIQEEFDCEVLEIEWNDFLIAKRPGIENIIKYSARYFEKKTPDDLVNWYVLPNESEFPKHILQFMCMKQNVSWDLTLRQAYIKFINRLFAGVAFVLMICAAFSSISIAQFFIFFLFAMLPLLKYSWFEIRQNKNAIARLEHLYGLMDSLWLEFISGYHDDNSLRIKIRNLQNQIFLHRERSPKIKDYRFYKSKNSIEETINEIVNRLAYEFNQRKKL